MQTLVIDGSNLVYRAFYAFKYLTNAKGYFTGGVYGFMRILDYYRSRFETNRIIVCWDSSHSWREDVYPAYKAKRRKKRGTKENLAILQVFKDVEKFCEYCGILSLKKKDLEADDLIALVVRLFKKDLLIVSRDKDMLQFVSDKNNIKVVHPKGKLDDVETINVDSVKKMFSGIKPERLKYYFALMGDSVDEVKGVSGIGSVGAKKILKEHFTSKSIGKMLSKSDEKVFKRNLELVDLSNLPFKMGFESLFSFKPPRQIMLKHFLNELEIKKYAEHELVTKFYAPRFKMSFLKALKNEKIQT